MVEIIRKIFILWFWILYIKIKLTSPNASWKNLDWLPLSGVSGNPGRETDCPSEDKLFNQGSCWKVWACDTPGFWPEIKGCFNYALLMSLYILF